MSAGIENRRRFTVLVRGGGEMATGVAHRLFRSGFRVCITEIPAPLAVRREVAFGEAVFEGRKEVEGLVARRVADTKEILEAWEERMIPLLGQPQSKPECFNLYLFYLHANHTTIFSR